MRFPCSASCWPCLKKKSGKKVLIGKRFVSTCNACNTLHFTVKTHLKLCTIEARMKAAHVRWFGIMQSSCKTDKKYL